MGKQSGSGFWRMKTRMKIKMGIDLLMTVLLICLMAYQITGQKLHEWIGAGMLLLFILHHILNLKWYQNLFSGKYRGYRIIQTFLNFGVLIAMLCLAYSGIILSRYAFAAFSIDGPMATARKMHMSASYWGFVLMSMHLGMHWGMIRGMFRKICKDWKIPKGVRWGLQIAVVLISVYGLVCFIQKNIISYMFLKNEFVFFDFEQSAGAVFFDYIAMMLFWAAAAFFITKEIGKSREVK